MLDGVINVHLLRIIKSERELCSCNFQLMQNAIAYLVVNLMSLFLIKFMLYHSSFHPITMYYSTKFS